MAKKRKSKKGKGAFGKCLKAAYKGKKATKAVKRAAMKKCAKKRRVR